MESTEPRPPVFFKNPTVATICSFFICGLGQLYNGQIGKGVLFFVMFGISIGLISVFIGFFLAPLMWLWGMVDANRSAKRINEQLARGASSA